jgi:hypothetical protein
MIPFDLYDAPPLRPANPGYLEDVLAIPTHPMCPPGDETRDHLTVAMGHAPSAGHIIECGVWQGKTLNHLASLVPYRTVWGFDSFYGLPEHWTDAIPKGHFSTDGKPPDVLLENVRLAIGLFADTIPAWLQENPGNIALLHVDCDLYTSATTVLSGFNARLQPGSIVVFDDLHEFDRLPYPPPAGWQAQEWMAMEDWAARFERRFSVVSRLWQCCLAVRILR